MKKRLQLLFLLFAFGLTAIAQQKTVTGRVSTTNGGAAEGINVVIKGNKKGAITTENGQFSITAKEGDVLVFSGVGFESQELTIRNGEVNVTLKNTVGDLGEVVVLGYGSQKKANLTGAVVALNNAELNKRQVSSATQILQGLAPGVSVQQQSGRPGADGASIRIRGESSILGNSSPLIILDGVVIDNAAFNLLDPNTIENVTVLKDAASTAIYGNRASGGVIVIKTKRAKGKGLNVSYNSFVSVQNFTSIPERVSAIDHMELSNLAEQNRTGNPSAFVFPASVISNYKSKGANNLDVIDTDWLKEVLTNSGIMQNHNIQFTSGGEKISMFGSFTYFDQQGLIQNNSFRKYDLRLNPEIKLNDWLNLNGVIAYTDSRTINPSTGSPEFIIRQAIGLPAIGGGKFGEGQYGNAAQSNNRNPIAMAEAAGTSAVQGANLLTKVSLVATPINGLELEATWARDKRNPYTKTFVKNVDIYQPNLSTQGWDKVTTWPGTTSLSESWRNDIYTSYQGQAAYKFSVAERHNIKVMAGAQRELYSNYFFGASRQGFNNPNQPFLNVGTGVRDNNSGASELALIGIYGRINYSFDDKYFLELNGRRDASSRYSQAKDNQWGNFGSVSAGWNFSEEKFFSKLKNTINYGKIRVSTGGLGNQNFNNYAFDAFYGSSNYSNNTNGTNAYFNNITNVGVAILQFPNPDISWETSKQTNVGLDLTVMKNITITADYFVRTLKDMILQRTLPASAGGLGNPFINAGNMENKGWELSVGYRMKRKDFGFNGTFMISDAKNNVTGLVSGLPFLGDFLRTTPGEALNSYFGYKALGFFSDSNEIKSSPVQFGQAWNATSAATGTKPGDTKYADISGPAGVPDGIVDANDRTFIGNAAPRYEYSLNLNFTYKNWDLNIFGQGVGKRNNYLSGTGATPFASSDFAASLLEQHKNHWRTDNLNPDFPRLLPSGFGGNNYLPSSWWVRSAAYFRIKNVNVGYTFNEALMKKIKIKSGRIFVSGQNLLTITKAWKGFDPEINNANAEFYPLMRTFTAGVNVSF